MLLIAILGVGSVAGLRVLDRIDRPQVGDRHEVAYEGEDECGYIHIRSHDLVLRGEPDLREAPRPDGDGTLVITRVEDVGDGRGVSVSGTLTLDDGDRIPVQGGTRDEVFFTLGCRIRR